MRTHIEKLRTRLRDMAFGRTKLEVISSCEGEHTQLRPVFVVTTFRSGSTFLRLLLNSHSEVCCPPETKFLVHLAALWADEATRKGLDSLGYSPDYVRARLRALAADLYGPHLKAAGRSVLIDKTPEYVRILDFVDWLYEGEVKYIVLFRNGLDVAQSMMETPLDVFDKDKDLRVTFNYWKTDAELMLEWKGRHPDRCHVTLYEDLCDDLEGEVRNALAFVGLAWEESIREWFNKGHARGHEDIKARRQRSVNKRFGTFKQWDQALIAEFKGMAKSIHEAMGYDPCTLRPKRP